MSGSRRKARAARAVRWRDAAHGCSGGYSPSVVIRSLIALAHLGRSIEREALAVDHLTTAVVSTFV